MLLRRIMMLKKVLSQNMSLHIRDNPLNGLSLPTIIMTSTVTSEAMFTVASSEAKGQEGTAKERNIRHSTFEEPHSNHVYEGLLSIMQYVQSCLDNLDKAHNPVIHA
jgi:hypothetical protein